MSDSIILREVEVKSRIGVPVKERQRPQRLTITVELKGLSLRKAGKSDGIEKTINYFPIYQGIKKLAQARPRKLLETLAEEIAAWILSEFPVKRVRVEVRKFIFPDASYVAVAVSRRKK